MLGHRATAAAGADGVPQPAVALDQPLLGHHQRLGVVGDVAVVAGVGQGRRQDREAAGQGLDIGLADAGDGVEGARGVIERRLGGGVAGAASATVGDEHLAVPLLLRRRRRPRPARLEEGQDRVAVAVLPAVLAAYDERDRAAAVGGRRVHVGGGLRRVVRLQRRLPARLVEVGVAGRLVAQGVARRVLAVVRRRDRPAEHGPAVAVVGDHRACPTRAVRASDQHVAAVAQPAKQHGGAGAERLRDVASVEGDPQVARASRLPHRHQYVPAGHQVGPVGQDLDHDAGRCGRGGRGPRRRGRYGAQQGGQHGQDDGGGDGADDHADASGGTGVRAHGRTSSKGLERSTTRSPAGHPEGGAYTLGTSDHGPRSDQPSRAGDPLIRTRSARSPCSTPHSTALDRESTSILR